MAETFLDAEIDDPIDFFIEHFFRQAERGDVGAHQPAALRILLEQRDVIAERQQIAGDGE